MDQALLDEMEKRGMMPGPEPEVENSFGGSAKAVASGAAKGFVAGTVGLPGDLEHAGRWAYGTVKGEPITENRIPFRSEDIYKGMAGALYKPQTQQEKYLEAGGEGAAALINPFGLAGKGKLVSKGTLAAGAAMGLGSEAGRNLLEGNEDVGGVVGASVPTVLKAISGSPAVALRLLVNMAPTTITRLLRRHLMPEQITGIARALLTAKQTKNFVTRQSAIGNAQQQGEQSMDQLAELNRNNSSEKLMAGWAGGVWSRAYNWTADAVGSIKIRADKMDTEWTHITNGFNNCITRDGLGKPAANMDWNGVRLTNLGAGTAPTDAATVAQTAPTQWSPDSSAALFITATQFKALAADKTTFYAPGRRIQLTGTAGFYRTGTVVSSSYAVPDTTVNAVIDSGTITADLNRSYYGVGDYVTPGYLSPRSAVSAINVGAQSFVPGWQKFPFDSVPMDALGEFSAANFRFTPKYPGVFRISGNCAFVALATATVPIQVALYKNGVGVGTYAYNDARPLITSSLYSVPFSVLYPVYTVGDYLEIFMNIVVVNWQAAGAAVSSYVCIDRIV